MAREYKALSVIGEVYYLDHDLSPAEERDGVDGGHIEIVPSTYRVLSDNYEAGPEGTEFEAALPMETEAALIQGGHIERVEKAPTKPVAKSATKKKG